MPPRFSPEVESLLKQHVEQQKCSDLNKAQYCRQHNLNYDQFQYMLRKTCGRRTVTETEIESSRPSNFVPVFIGSSKNTSRATQSSFSITRANGARLEWACDWSVEQVAHFIAQWENEP